MDMDLWAACAWIERTFMRILCTSTRHPSSSWCPVKMNTGRRTNERTNERPVGMNMFNSVRLNYPRQRRCNTAKVDGRMTDWRPSALCWWWRQQPQQQPVKRRSGSKSLPMKRFARWMATNGAVLPLLWVLSCTDLWLQKRRRGPWKSYPGSWCLTMTWKINNPVFRAVCGTM